MTDTGRGNIVDVGARARQSHDRAVAGGATLAERAVLAAVHYWLATYTKTNDRVSLGQLAVTAGLHPAPASSCPKDTTKRVSERLHRLQELGAIVYRPGGGGRASSLIALPKVNAERGPAVPPSPAERGSAVPPSERGSAVPPSTAVEGASAAPERGPAVPPRGGPWSPPSREVPEKTPEGGLSAGTEPQAHARTHACEAGSEPQDAAALAARLAACTTPGPLPDEAERTIALLVELVGHDATTAAVTRAEQRAADRADADDPLPAGVAARFAADLNGHGDDPRLLALGSFAGPWLLAHTGARWTDPDDVADVADVAAWLDDLDDDDARATALDAIAADRPKTARLAMRTARNAVPALDRLDLPARPRKATP